MEPPPGLADYGNDKVIWKLQKSLYGLKQASCLWYEKAKEQFAKLGFTQCNADFSVFIHVGPTCDFCIIALYVDDLMVLSNSLGLLDQKKAKLMQVFKMKDLGPIHWFLGLEIKRDHLQHLITVSQSRYVSNIVEHFGFTNSRPVSTPVAVNLKLPCFGSPETNI